MQVASRNCAQSPQGRAASPSASAELSCALQCPQELDDVSQVRNLGQWKRLRGGSSRCTAVRGRPVYRPCPYSVLPGHTCPPAAPLRGQGALDFGRPKVGVCAPARLRAGERRQHHGQNARTSSERGLRAPRSEKAHPGPLPTAGRTVYRNTARKACISHTTRAPRCSGATCAPLSSVERA